MPLSSLVSADKDQMVSVTAIESEVCGSCVGEINVLLEVENSEAGLYYGSK